MNIIYEQSFDFWEDSPSLEERIDGQLYEPTTDGVAQAEYDLISISELASRKRVELYEARQQLKVTSNPEFKQQVELREWELGELAQRETVLRWLLPRLRRIYHKLCLQTFAPLGDEDEAERRPTSIEDIFGERQ